MAGCGVPAVAGSPSSPYKMVSVDDAVSFVLTHVVPLPPVTVPLAAAHGRVLAQDVHAAEPQPPFRASIKDGYAVRAADGAGEFPVVADSRAAAADAPAAPLAPASVAYITTGAPLPEGADAVVQVENTVDVTAGPGAPRRVRIVTPARAPGEDVRAVGSDVAAGECVLRAGDRLGAAEVGILASVGAATVSVHPAPRVAVLSTGDELVDPATPVGAMRHGAVRDANRAMLLAGACTAAAQPGLAASLAPACACAWPCVTPTPATEPCLFRPQPLLRRAPWAWTSASPPTTPAGLPPAWTPRSQLVRTCSSRPAVSPWVRALTLTLRACLPVQRAHGVTRSAAGGTPGDRDLVKPLLESRGTVHFGRVHMKPGKPLTFATVARASTGGGASPAPPLLVFGLPGNPVSSLVTFQLVALPTLRALAGWRAPGLRRVAVTSTAPLRLDPERPEYHRATLAWADGRLVATSTGGQISSRLLSARSAGALLELPAAAGTLPAGTTLSALLVADAAAADGLAHTPRIMPVPVPPTPAPAAVAAATAAATPAASAASAAAPAAASPPRIGVLTVSDRASAGIYEDLSGPAIVAVLRDYLATPCEFVTRVVPDERPLIAAALRELAAGGACLVCTTGGTGPAVRDVTPEAMADVCDKMLPGFGEAMRAASLRSVPTAILSRQEAGTSGRTLILNIPGKPAAVRVCLDAVWPAIPYCIDLLEGPRLEGRPGAAAVFRPQPK
jgi:molybdenum cofactor synthesis domain-containing protein